MGSDIGVAALARLLPALTVVVAGLLGVRWWLQRDRGGRRPGLRVCSRASVGRNTVVAVVEADGRRFLVGGGDQRLALLAELDAHPEDVPEAVDDADEPSDTPAALTLPGWERTSPRPRTGLVDQLRTWTVRSHVRRPVRGIPHR